MCCHIFYQLSIKSSKLKTLVNIGLLLIIVWRKIMILKENELLSKYTTFKMGGIAQRMYFPESVEELQTVVMENNNIINYIIGGGSNLLINDERVFSEVLCLRNFNLKFDNLQNGKYYIGASVRLQKVIKTVNEDGYGGIEYLYSVPGLIGGAVYMNAGRGKKYNNYISDYIQSVDLLIDGKVRTIPKKDCGFGYRTSVFQSRVGCVILGALFEFPFMSKTETTIKVQERIDLCKRVQDMSGPNFGTVFCESNKYIMTVVRKIHLGYKNGCTFSSKTKNWMIKGTNGTFEQAVTLLNTVKRWHKFFGLRCRAEVRLWT